MKKNFKYILTILIFIMIPLMTKKLMPTIGASSTFDLMYRFIIDVLVCATIIYLYYNEIVQSYQILKKNSNKILSNILFYLVLLCLGYFLGRLIIFAISKTNSKVVFMVNLLYYKAPIYMFINTIIYMPIIETIVFRMIPKKIIKNYWLFIIISALLYAFHSSGTLGISSIFITSLISGLLLSYAFAKSENIVLLTLIHTAFNIFVFAFNYYL